MVAVVRWYLSAFHAGRKVVIVFCLFGWFFSETTGGGGVLHVTREFHPIKLICRNLYAIFSHVKKPIQPIRMAYSCFHMWKYNQSTTA